MTIESIVQTVRVKAPPSRAFALFTQEMGRWWKAGIGKQIFTDVVMEPYVGGRWFERSADGVETDWGRVLAWEPPARLLLAWQLNAKFEFDAHFVTEVEVVFAAVDGGTTMVTLEHRNLEFFGESADTIAGKLRSGWLGMLDRYVQHVATTH